MGTEEFGKAGLSVGASPILLWEIAHQVGYTSDMSIFNRASYLTLAALLAIVPAACGGDDDDDDAADDTSADDGAPDAAVETPDAAVETPDAAVIEGDEFLLGISLSALGQTGVIRAVATVALDGASADISLQALQSDVCVDKGTPASGEPIGEPLVATDVAIGVDGTFTINFVDADIPAGAIGIMLACTLPVTADTLDVSGQLLKDGTFCGTIEGTAVGMDISGTFGTVAIEADTPPEDLPEPVLECPALLLN